MMRRPPRSTLFPYTTLFRSASRPGASATIEVAGSRFISRFIGHRELEGKEPKVIARSGLVLWPHRHASPHKPATPRAPAPNPPLASSPPFALKSRYLTTMRVALHRQAEGTTPATSTPSRLGRPAQLNFPRLLAP